MKIYTKKGDTGKTSLLYGKEVEKFDPRCEAYGTIDEAVACLGLAKSLSNNNVIIDYLTNIQKELFVIGSELATPIDIKINPDKKIPKISDENIKDIEKEIDRLVSNIKIENEFILPGTSPISSCLHLARAIIRRCERQIVKLYEDDQLLNIFILHYINRLSDFIFVLSKYQDRNENEEHIKISKL
jgi:cob(I)alamin adenosyltransferase